MALKPAWEPADVQAILTGVFHIKAYLAEIVDLLGGESDEEEDEGPESA